MDFAKRLYLQKDYQTAVEEYQNALAEELSDKERHEALYMVAACQFRLNAYKKATLAYEKALQAAPENARAGMAWYNLARALLKQNARGKALDAFRNAMKKGEGSVKKQAMIGAGEQMVALNQFAAVIPHYQTFLHSFPKAEAVPDVKSSLAWALRREDKHEQALTVYQKLLEQYPEYQPAETRLAICDVLCRLNRYQEAKEMLQELDDEPDPKGQILMQRAWVHFLADSKAKAAQLFLAFADQFPESASLSSALTNAGKAFFQEQQFDEAIKVFKRLQKLDLPESQKVEAWYWLALSHYSQKQFAKAASVFEQLMDDFSGLKPSDQVQALFVYGQILSNLGKNQTAVKVLDRMIKHDHAGEKAISARYAKALALAEVNELSGAVTTLREMLALEFENEALERDARFALSEYLYRLGKNEKALSEMDAIAKGDKPFPPHVQYRRAWVLYETEKHQDAANAFAQLSLKESRFKSEAFYMAGRALEKVENTETAAEWYKRLLDLPKARKAFARKACYRLAFLITGEDAMRNLTVYRKRFGEDSQYMEMALKEAESAFLQLDKQHPNNDYLTEAAIRAAKALHEHGNSTKAVNVLAALPRKRVPEKYLEEFLELQTDLLIKVQQWEKAVKTCHHLLKLFPDSDRAYLAWFRLGLANKALGISGKALEAFENTVDATDTIEAAKARLNTGLIQLQENQPKEAAKSFLKVDMLYDYPTLSSKALFYAVRAFRKAGNDSSAELYLGKLKERFPDSEWVQNASED